MKIFKIMIITAVSITIGFTGVVASGATAYADGSASSTITQVIRAVDCAHTTYDQAVGQMNDAECDVFDPKHERTEIADSGYPIMYGVYDAIHAVIDPATGRHSLAVEVAGRRFVLGVDPELRVDGNAWVLDLSNWTNTHPTGAEPVLERGKTYPVVIFTIVNPYGSAQQVSQTVNSSITIPEVPTGLGLVGIIEDSIDGILAATGANVWAVVVVMLGLVVFAVLILLRRKKRGGEYG